jgi:hypothetical protein
MEPRLEAAIPAARKLRRASCRKIDLPARYPRCGRAHPPHAPETARENIRSTVSEGKNPAHDWMVPGKPHCRSACELTQLPSSARAPARGWPRSGW